MRVQRNLASAADAPVALTIGNFDGVHRGHQAMLSRLIEAAEDLRLAPAVMTFDPHPREFFAPAAAPPRLSTLRAKLDLFRAYGIAITYVARFNARLASLTAGESVQSVLEDGVYYGVWVRGQLISAAGTHVINTHEGIAVVGNVMTQVDYRGHDFAKMVTSAVTAELLERVGDVALNVHTDNLPAVALGTGGLLVRRGEPSGRFCPGQHARAAHQRRHARAGDRRIVR